MMAPTSRDPLQPLFEALGRLRAAWPSGGWSHDSRLSCVASTFTTDVLQKARAAAAEALPIEWTERSLATAPGAVRELAKRHDGIRAGQMLLASAPIGHIVAYGLWWPWGDNRTISLRVGIEGASVDPTMRLCEVFRVEM